MPLLQQILNAPVCFKTLRMHSYYSCLMRLTALEEVNLSSNRLSSVSPAFGMLPNLQILRLHSNLITSIPDLSHSPSLFVRFSSLDCFVLEYWLLIPTIIIKSCQNELFEKK